MRSLTNQMKPDESVATDLFVRSLENVQNRTRNDRHVEDSAVINYMKDMYANMIVSPDSSLNSNQLWIGDDPPDNIPIGKSNHTHGSRITRGLSSIQTEVGRYISPD